ncbi:MAG TPA: hypothetical protein P5318_11615 [Candidatus Hydrogenedentes bacterium]|nr:hypothetical protein [Candidatus Hydrogenedentota bacterium]HOV73637.1 hypothetical protein [Candidatus Hydrogenedentota bacterium]HPC16319.1 hypothetical protein [Candidatus Hydrogenedentota bacterium]HRT20763.1 hypothetical protein [Candidatus Hydrogenedentota bacterium]HRT66290.1 hypothetical protein [Candidatus Hydrogenedentota bacterium]
MNSFYRKALSGVATVLAIAGGLAAWGESYSLKVFPPEHKRMVDEETGATLTFLTSDPAADTNFYFHERSWSTDSSIIYFYSARREGGLMGYLTRTGELIRFETPKGPVGSATASLSRNSVYVLRGKEVLEFAPSVEIARNPAKKRSRVMVVERSIATLTGCSPHTALNESCDGKHLAVGVSRFDDDDAPGIVTIQVETGEVKTLCRFPKEPGYGGHVQWSRTNPNLLSFAGRIERLNIVDIRDGSIRMPYKAIPDELVTHESWWVNDQMMFCGGVHPKPIEDSHVKLLDIATGEVRIVGEGAWWPQATPEQVAKRNWWHASGSVDGAWVAADNWHGDIMLFEGRTTRPRLLTTGHRTYGKGEHPHVGWDRMSAQVVFTSHKLGSPDVCIATIPAEWRAR